MMAFKRGSPAGAAAAPVADGSDTVAGGTAAGIPAEVEETTGLTD